MLPLFLFIMSTSTNVAENMPVAKPILWDEKSEDLEALVRQLEATKAKNDQIMKRKKEKEEAKCQKEAEAKQKANEAEAKWVPDKPEAKQKADEAEAEQVHNAEEVHKRKVSTTQILVVLG